MPSANAMSSPEKIGTGQTVPEPVRISRPEKVLFPKDGIAKAELVDYYQRVAPAILPFLADRPISMERYPDGITGQGFFQKKAGPYFPNWVRTVSMPKKNGTVRHVVCDDADTLVYLAGQAVITPHTWLSRADKPNYPDQLIFDLDPATENFPEVCETAAKLRDLLSAHELISFVKTTGSRGLHVTVFLDRQDEFDDVRAFAHEMARQLVSDDPDRLTTEVRKNKRGDRIFIDTARNGYAQTAVPPYAVRARDGAPVAAPLAWEELKNPKLRSGEFNIRNIFARLESAGDPWKTMRPQRLPRDA
jgi:bifunctional non-homologous end joining protein LigD